MVFRYDFAPISGYDRTDEGYLRVWCKAARTGIQEYRRPDGTVRREYRPMEEVGSPTSLETVGMKPVTWEHPPVLLDSQNTKQFQIGYTGSKVEFDGKYVTVALTVTDQKYIDKILNKEATEVSLGYKVDYKDTPGKTEDGESYDGIQTNIRVNHCAVVKRGRAGPDVKLLLDRLDSGDAVADSSFSEPQITPREKTPMAQVNLDGLTVDLPSEAAAAVQAYVQDTKRSMKDQASEMDALRSKCDELQQAVDALYADREALLGKTDAYEEALQEMQQKLDSADVTRIDQAEIDRLVVQRLTLLDSLYPVLPEDVVLDGMSERDLYVTAYQNIFPNRNDNFDEMDDSYLRGVVHGVLAALPPEEAVSDEPEPHTDSTEEFQRFVSGAAAPQASPVAVYRQSIRDEWKQPLTAHK